MSDNNISLKLTKRDVQGKKVAGLREDGFIPSVIYGQGEEPMNVQSANLDTIKVVKAAGRHSAIHLDIDGEKKLAIIKSIDFDPVKHVLRHIAFQAIDQNQEIETEVAIHLDGVGESPAERAGLVVLQAIEHIEIKAKPADLPEALHISLDSLATTEDKLTLADIKLPEGVQFAELDVDLSLVVANVYEPSALQAANEAAAGDAEAGDEAEVESEEGSGEESEQGDKPEGEDKKSDDKDKE